MSKIPFLTKQKAEEIAAAFPTPFHIYDEKGISENAERVNSAFSWNPGYREYFAVKAMPTPAVLKLLKSRGCGADCASMAELLLAEKCGFSGSEIMFSSNNTPDEEFVKARELGATINLDDITHIDVLNRLCGIPETICCRYNPGGIYSVSNHIMDNPGDAKYGMTRPQIFEAFARLKELGAKKFGIHAFLASNTLTDYYYPQLAEQLFTLARDLQYETGAQVAFINLSGGVGVNYQPDGYVNDILKIGEGVRQAYENVLLPAGMSDVAVFTEMGRFMLAPYGHLITRAIREKHIYKEYIGVDSSACDLMRPAIYGAYHHITVLGKEDAPCDHVYDVAGALCENNDKFAIDRNLPEIETGDLLCIHDTGAHGRAMGYNYNGKLRSGEVLLHPDGTFSVIRRRETVDDYFATIIW
ncbi:MAG: diaminopimelate decarboxylase [Oscillospiraceae bacterium]|jgi:diaminopimelate decarboxylase|nr:diaminopimelate decarboxylase [Oscillospiraceae bacterium]